MNGRILSVLVVLCLSTHPSAAQQKGPVCVHSDPSPTRISSDDVRFSGATRLMDLFRLMPDWHTVSTDMYLWDVSPGIYALPEWNAMTVMVDGQPLTASFLGTAYLNAFPLDVSAVDSIEIFEGPVLCDGVFAPSGLVHLYTRLEKPIASAGGGGAMVSQSGEPGPYRFSPARLPNVDRSGPVGSGFASIAGGGFHARVTAVTDEHHVTQPLLRRRVDRLYKSDPPARHFLGGERADLLVRHPERSFSVSVEQSRFDHFRYMPSLGSEWPLITEWFRFGGHAHTHVWRGASLYFSGETSEFVTGAYRDSPLIEVRWQTNHWQWQAGTIVRFSSGFAALGVGAFRDGARTLDDAFESEDFAKTWHGHSSVAISRRVHVQGFGTMVRQAGRTLRNGSLTGIWRPIDGHSARLTLTGIQLPPYQTVPYLYRASQGLATHVIQGLVPEVQVPTRHASRFTTTAAWRWDHRFGAITVSGTGARFSRFPIARYDLVFVEEQDRFMKNLAYFVSETHVVSDGSGRVARLAVDLEARPLRDVMVRMNYARTRASSAKPEFETAWAQLPEHRAFASVTFAPHHRASVQARLSWESWSDWPDYHAVMVASESRYTDRLPVLALLDVGVTKRFWDDHLDASVLLTNVLNRPFQRHPAGMTEPISMHVRLQVRI